MNEGLGLVTFLEKRIETILKLFQKKKKKEEILKFYDKT